MTNPNDNARPDLPVADDGPTPIGTAPRRDGARRSGNPSVPNRDDAERLILRAQQAIENRRTGQAESLIQAVFAVFDQLS